MGGPSVLVTRLGRMSSHHEGVSPSTDLSTRSWAVLAESRQCRKSAVEGDTTHRRMVSRASKMTLTHPTGCPTAEFLSPMRSAGLSGSNEGTPNGTSGSHRRASPFPIADGTLGGEVCGVRHSAWEK